MGFNYYARRIPSVEDKEELKRLIDENKFKSALEKAKEMYEEDGTYTRYGSLIHIGTRSRGWKFLWDPNHWKVCEGYMQDGKYVPNYVIKKYYDLNKESIREFLSRPDIMIISENYRDDMEPVDSTDPEDTCVWTVDEFMEMALTHDPDGWDSKSYGEKSNGLQYHSERIELFKSLGYEIEGYDFYSDGLRFSIHETFR